MSVYTGLGEVHSGFTMVGNLTVEAGSSIGTNAKRVPKLWVTDVDAGGTLTVVTLSAGSVVASGAKALTLDGTLGRITGAGSAIEIDKNLDLLSTWSIVKVTNIGQSATRVTNIYARSLDVSTEIKGNTTATLIDFASVQNVGLVSVADTLTVGAGSGTNDTLIENGVIGASTQRVDKVWATALDVSSLTVGSLVANVNAGGKDITNLGDVTFTSPVTITVDECDLVILSNLDISGGMQCNGFSPHSGTLITLSGNLSVDTNDIRNVVVLDVDTIAVNDVSGPTITGGLGAPTSTPPNGSLYLRTDGGAAASLYVRHNGAWTAVTIP